MQVDLQNEETPNKPFGYHLRNVKALMSNRRQLDHYRTIREASKRDAISSEEELLKKLGLIHQLLSRSDTYRNRSVSTSSDLLDRVLEEVEAIKHNTRVESNKSDCNIQGQWVSDSAGGIFDFANVEPKGRNIPIKRKSAQDSVHFGFMNVKDWSTMLTFPYANSSQYIIVIGMNKRDKIVATFMGECRVCRKREVLQGNWLIVSHSRDCESLGTTAKLISDVWRRDNLDKLKKKHIALFKNKKFGQKQEMPDTEPQVTTSAPATAESFKKKHNETKTTPLRIKLH